MKSRGWRSGAVLIATLLLVACSTPAPGGAAAPTSAPPPAQASVAPVASAAPAGSAPSLAAAPSVSASPSAAPAAASGPAQHVRVLWAARVANMAPARLALDAGYFAEQGLDVDLTYVNGSGTAIADLISGDSDIVELAAPAVVAASVQQTGDSGTKPEMIAGTLNTEDLMLMARPSLTSVSDLKGKNICVGEIGSFGDIALRLTLKSLNLDPDKDVSIIRGGSIDGCVAALIAGATDAFETGPPLDVVLQRQGMNILVNTQELKVPLQELGVATTRAYAQAHPDTVTRFLRAYIQAIHRWKTDKAFAEDEMRKYLQLNDQEELDDSWQIYVTGFEEVPLVPDQAMQNVLDTIAAAKGTSPDDFRDNHFVQEIQQSGFIKQVYGD